MANQSFSQQYPEIYTINNSPYGAINPTGDFYIPYVTGTNDGFNLNNAGSWTVASAAVPSPVTIWLFVSALPGFIGFSRRN